MCEACGDSEHQKVEIMKAGIQTGIYHMDSYSDYYPGLNIYDIEYDSMAKAINISTQITQHGEASFDDYMQELLLDLSTEMRTNPKEHISMILRRFSERKFKDKDWWGNLTKDEINELLSGIREYYATHTLLLESGLAEAYKFGKFHTLLTESMTLKQAKNKVKTLKLNPYDKARLDTIQQTSGLFMDRVIQRQVDTAAIKILERNRDFITKVLVNNDEKSWRSLASDIYHGMERDAKVVVRDIDRITRTEIAHSQNYAILMDGKDRGKKYAIVRVRDTACPLCKGMYLNKDGTPKKFLLDDLIGVPRDVNWGKKPKDFKLQAPVLHPYCFCVLLVLA
jgi:hypothetical protein